MTTVMLAEPTAAPTNRRRPAPGPGRKAGRGHQVAPPVVDAFGPWVAILEQSETQGEFRWVVGPDGVLLPIRQTGDAQRPRSMRRAVRGRLTALRRR
ncbi:MAG: hypothetical protein QOJ78_464 [Pseudonocardiales bacterium]|jgi:hypothetical protein|nr:hypothetical protein [Pseudonocardiales bacterium]